MEDLEERFARLVIESECMDYVEVTKSLLVSLGLQEAETEMNVIGTENLVSTDCVLREIEYARVHKTIDKLEIEDVLLRRANRDVVLLTIQDMLCDQAGGRVWENVAFIDCINVDDRSTDAHGLSRVLFRLCDYEINLSQLCTTMWAKHNKSWDENSLTFRVKLQIGKGATLDDFLTVLRFLRNSKAARVDFGGVDVLSGHAAMLIPHKLPALFGCESKRGLGKLCTVDKLELNLFYCPMDQSSQTRNYTKVLLSQCIKKLVDMKTRQPEEEDGAIFVTGNGDRNRLTRRRSGVHDIEWSGLPFRTTDRTRVATKKVPRHSKSARAVPSNPNTLHTQPHNRDDCELPRISNRAAA